MNNKAIKELKNEDSSALRLLPHRVGNSISKQLPPQFLIFLIGQLVSKLGDALFTFAIPWISYELTHSVIVMGSMYAVSVLPIVLFGPIIGMVVDHWDRRRLMMFADVTRAILVAFVPFMQMLGILQLWQLYVVSFLLAGLSLLFDVSVVASMPNIIRNKNLTKANASYQLVNQGADLIGPILAGIMITTLGGYRTLWFDVVSFAGTLWAIWRIQSLGKPVAKTGLSEIFRGMGEGLRFLIHDKLNFSLSLQAMIGNFGYSAAYGVLMFYLLSTLHLNAVQISYNYSFLGLGGLVSNSISPVTVFAIAAVSKGVEVSIALWSQICKL